MPAQSHPVDVVADQDREFGVAAVVVNGDAGDRADQGFAGRQRFGGDQGELAARVGTGQAFGLLHAQFLHRMQEALANLIRLQQHEGRAQRHGVLGADRADQHLATIGEVDFFVPRGHAVAGGHPGIIPATGLRK